MEGRIYPEPVVGALIFNKEGKVFLMKSHKWKNKFNIPGGHVELGEKMEDALKREIKEETGLDIYDLKFLYSPEFIFGDDFWKKKHFISHDFTCKTDSENVVLSNEGQEYFWVYPEEALKMDLCSFTRKTIEEYLKGKD